MGTERLHTEKCILVNRQTQLSQGIQAAKNGDKTNAQDLLYAVIDEDPRNETAWMWLSYAVNSAEDRQICLENVLTINPNNAYALRGLAKLGQDPKLKKTVAVKPLERKTGKSRSIPLLLTIAFWFGLGFLLIISGLLDLISWGLALLTGPVIPNYITSYQLWLLIVAVGFMALGIVLLNIAWAQYIEHKFGYYAGILFSLFFVFFGPLAVLISERPNYLLAAFLIIMPAIILFLTLFGRADTTYDPKLAPHPERH